MVTLQAGDSRAEYLFQSEFQSVPQVLYSLSSFSFLLDTRKTPAPSYGSYRPWREPNALGALVTAHSSRHGVTFERSALSFGDTATSKVGVSFQACTISTGKELAPEVFGTTTVLTP